MNAWQNGQSFGRWAAALAALAASSVFGQSITVTTDHPSGVYAVGEPVTWTVRYDGLSGPLPYEVLPNQGSASKSGTLPPAVAPANGPATRPSGTATVTAMIDAPGTVLLKVHAPGVKNGKGEDLVGVGGAIAAPGQIKPSAPRPDDFDAFWDEQIKTLRAVPADPRLTPGDAARAGVQYQLVTLTGIHESHVQGQIARPVSGDKFPAVLQVQWAGVYGLQKGWVVDRAAGGWLAMDIEAHDLPIDRPEQFYKDQFAGPLHNYWAIGNDSRETSYFLRMYLSCVRAVDYLKTRPDWDGRTIVVTGESQGGQQTLVTAGLCEGLTAAIANVPAGCDMLGPQVGRRGGWPQWWDWTRGLDFKGPEEAAKVHEASRYFDAVNFASRIKCPILVGTGLIDETCPSDGVVAAFNQIPGRKQLVLMPGAPHQNVNDTHKPFADLAWGRWLPALVKGGEPPVPATPGL